MIAGSLLAAAVLVALLVGGVRAGVKLGEFGSVEIQASARLLNAFANQVETMRRLRNGGTQVIRVERIEVSDNAQAIIGNIKSKPHEV
jgi:hypothetical protein